MRILAFEAICCFGILAIWTTDEFSLIMNIFWGLVAAILAFDIAKAVFFSIDYVRLAPGIIQFVSFGLGRNKPIVRSYPMTTGTMVILGKFGRLQHRVFISRNGQADWIWLSGMQNSSQALDCIWRAILSTAPTPPLSDEHLVG